MRSRQCWGVEEEEWVCGSGRTHGRDEGPAREFCARGWGWTRRAGGRVDLGSLEGGNALAVTEGEGIGGSGCLIGPFGRGSGVDRDDWLCALQVLLIEFGV